MIIYDNGIGLPYVSRTLVGMQATKNSYLNLLVVHINNIKILSP